MRIDLEKATIAISTLCDEIIAGCDACRWKEACVPETVDSAVQISVTLAQLRSILGIEEIAQTAQRAAATSSCLANGIRPD